MISSFTSKKTSTAIALCLFLTVMAWVLKLPMHIGFSIYNEQFLAFALGLVLAMGFLSSVHSKLKWFLAGTALVTSSSIAVAYQWFTMQLANPSMLAVVVAGISVLLVLEQTRRSLGTGFTVFLLLGIAYAVVGQWLPEAISSRPITLADLVTVLAIDSIAIIGSTLSAAITTVIPFLVFGGLLVAAGGTVFFSDLAAAAVGNSRGSTAKVSVVSSAIYGTVSGSAVTNVAAMGAVTIPAMKRAGVSAPTAAAIEAIGATGGQLVPPIMGAAAFIMAEYLNTSYAAVLSAALIPAIMFYTLLFAQVDFLSVNAGVPKAVAHRQSAKQLFKAGWFYLLPFATLIVAVAWLDINADIAALLAVLVLVSIAVLVNQFSFRKIITTITVAVESCVDIVVIAAAAGIFIGILNVTGIAFTITLQLLAVSEHSMFALLVSTAVAAVVLGLGLPTVGVYVLLATLVAPALTAAGIDPMAAHMFVLYYGILSLLTPPVAVANYTAANIAQCSAAQVDRAVARLSWPLYLIPFIFVFSPAALNNAAWYVVTWVTVSSLAGLVACAAAINSAFRYTANWAQRITFAVAAVGLLIPLDSIQWALYANIAGGCVFAVVARYNNKYAHANTPNNKRRY